MKLEETKKLSEDEDDFELSFEADMIELEEDEQSEEFDFETNFKKTKDKLTKMLDQVLYDVNCVNFFDKTKKSQINQYFDSLKQVLNQLIVDIKNNFSKM